MDLQRFSKSKMLAKLIKHSFWRPRTPCTFRLVRFELTGSHLAPFLLWTPFGYPLDPRSSPGSILLKWRRRLLDGLLLGSHPLSSLSALCFFYCRNRKKPMLPWFVAARANAWAHRQQLANRRYWLTVIAYELKCVGHPSPRWPAARAHPQQHDRRDVKAPNLQALHIGP